MTELEQLLSRLPPADESSASLTYEGKAVSRDTNNLHLAVSSGVIAIPLADIKEVKAVSGQSDDIVSVSVNKFDGVKQIRQASPMLNRGGFGGIGGLGGVLGNSGNTYSNGHYVDSATASGGRADSTDDAFWLEENDDVWT
jgi:hypothetical protein